MYNSKYRHLVPEEKYKILAGSDWPDYNDFLEYKESLQIPIRVEMEQMLGHEIKNYYKDYKKQRISYFKKLLFFGKMYHVWRAFVPGVVGALIFFYTSGTLLKFVTVGAICYVISFLCSITLHRWLAHRQFTPKIWARYFLLGCVIIAGLGHPAVWTGVHLIHHRNPDSDKDPHPTHNGFLDIMLMLTEIHPSMYNDPVFRRKQDKDIQFVFKHFWILHILALAVLACIDLDLFLLSFLFIKSGLVILNAVVNYFGHNGKINPKPSNVNNYIAVILAGETWHKNHHDDAKKFNQADSGKLDLGYVIMRAFAK